MTLWGDSLRDEVNLKGLTILRPSPPFVELRGGIVVEDDTGDASSSGDRPHDANQPITFVTTASYLRLPPIKVEPSV